MAEEITRDVLDLHVLTELERLNGVLEAVITHLGVPEKVIAAARLKVEMRQLDREQRLAQQQENFEMAMALGARRARLERQLAALEQAA